MKIHESKFFVDNFLLLRKKKQQKHTHTKYFCFFAFVFLNAFLLLLYYLLCRILICFWTDENIFSPFFLGFTYFPQKTTTTNFFPFQNNRTTRNPKPYKGKKKKKNIIKLEQQTNFLLSRFQVIAWKLMCHTVSSGKQGNNNNNNKIT